jgi:DNA-binding response OmpR family regulator
VLPVVVIVEDDENLAQELSEFISRYKMMPIVFDSVRESIAGMMKNAPDIIILDQWVGAEDALTHLGDIRAQTTAPIIVLTANPAETDRIVALETGADDFVRKPVSGRELVARIRAHLRRANQAAPVPVEEKRGGWRVSLLERAVYSPDGQHARLTSAEFELLVALMEKPGEPIDRDTLSTRVLKRKYQIGDRGLDNLVHHIRHKIPSDEGRPPVVVAVRHQGYVFTGFPE